jgi:galactokinase/mevalonate kinase-like predicted kinase
MYTVTQPWDYLIVTASNDAQAEAYRTQLRLRQELGLIPGVKQVLVVADPGGRRIGSGGSTIYSLIKVLNRELQTSPESGDLSESKDINEIGESLMSRLRILIIHAGGDSRRLPSYGPCGKLFIPVPGESDSALGITLFDIQLPVYLELPPPQPGAGQVVITTGDVFLNFDPDEVIFQAEGVTGLGSFVSPELSQNHGVFSSDEGGKVRCFLQKPSPAEQRARGAVNRFGHALLDIGVMNLNHDILILLFQLFNLYREENGQWTWSGPNTEEVLQSGMDFYREICCAMGKDVRFSDYKKAVRASGSLLSQELLKTLFDLIREIPFSAFRLSECTFLHFGNIRQILESGLDLLRRTQGAPTTNSILSVNNVSSESGHLVGRNAWVEGCRLAARVSLNGDNALVGVEVDEPLTLPLGACLDVLKGKDKKGKDIWFVRPYGFDDAFKLGIGNGGTFNQIPLEKWLHDVGTTTDAVWSDGIAEAERNLWNARLFPVVRSPQDYKDWLWMWKPGPAKEKQKQAWQKAEKFSFSDMAQAVDQENFFQSRWSYRAQEIAGSLQRIFRLESGFSSRELSFILGRLEPPQRLQWLVEILAEARRHYGEESKAGGMGRLTYSRIIHTLGSALKAIASNQKQAWDNTCTEVQSALSPDVQEWWRNQGLDFSLNSQIGDWGCKAQDSAFENLSRTIVLSKSQARDCPRNALRSDEIIWGRAPARLDLGGGWTDTPPYALERGGCVINAAVNLNGQPPIHVYARVIEQPEIRIASIDHGRMVNISSLEELLDYRKATSEFGLAKAALALSGFSLDKADWPADVTTLQDMLHRFGGGIEITTLAAIPSGSGLGTSSIMGAVLISVISRMLGQKHTSRELFNLVLQLEQELTTGGGWQDQIGGTVAGVKMITTAPGMVPDPRIHFVPDDVLAPSLNKGQTLLYYTGMRRLAKNILRNVVGNYLDRDRVSLDTLKKLHAYPPLMVDAMSRKNMRRFGGLIDLAWLLNKRLDPESSNADIEAILDRLVPNIYGAKLLGAGGGGFLLIVCRSQEAAQTVRRKLENDPPNDLARFFTYDISRSGLEVTVC